MTEKEVLAKALQFLDDIDQGEEFYINHILPTDKRSITEIINQERNNETEICFNNK